jgi:hypothetical protein
MCIRFGHNEDIFLCLPLDFSVLTVVFYGEDKPYVGISYD